MNEDRYAKEGAFGGILFVIFLIVGFLIVFPKPPATDASASEWARFFTDHQDAIRAGLTIVGVGTFFFIWFLGSLRSALATAEGGTGRLTSIAYGAGLLVVAFFIVALTTGLTAAYRPTEVDPGVTRVLADLFGVVGAPAAASFVAFFAATALAGLRYGALPRWAAWISAAAAVCQLGGFGIGVTTTGAFASDGALGFILPVASFMVAVLAISIALVRNPLPAPSPAAQ
jgi:hypothetical protein